MYTCLYNITPYVYMLVIHDLLFPLKMLNLNDSILGCVFDFTVFLSLWRGLLVNGMKVVFVQVQIT